MANIITGYYFIGEINLPDPMSESVGLFISKYEADYLLRALGYSFAKLFSDGLAADAVEQRWIDLRDGAEYDDARGITRKWTGFKNSGFNSPIANYIYYWYMRDNVTYTTTSGEAKGKSENSDSASSVMKQLRAYNAMVDMTKQLYDFLTYAKADGAATYSEFDVDETDCDLLDKLSLL